MHDIQIYINDTEYSQQHNLLLRVECKLVTKYEKMFALLKSIPHPRTDIYMAHDVAVASHAMWHERCNASLAMSRCYFQHFRHLPHHRIFKLGVCKLDNSLKLKGKLGS